MQEAPFIETNTSISITYNDLCSEIQLLTNTWIALVILSIVAVCVNLFLLFVMMKYRLWRSQFFVAVFSVGTIVSGVAFSMGYIRRIMDEHLVCQQMRALDCMFLPHISFYAIGDTLMSTSLFALAVERFFTVQAAINRSKPHWHVRAYLLFSIFLLTQGDIMIAWIAVLMPNFRERKTTALCFLKTTVPQIVFTIHYSFNCLLSTISVALMFFAMLLMRRCKASDNAIRNLQVKREAKVLRSTMVIVMVTFFMITLPTIVQLAWAFMPVGSIYPEIEWLLYVISLSIYPVINLTMNHSIRRATKALWNRLCCVTDVVPFVSASMVVPTTW